MEKFSLWTEQDRQEKNTVAVTGHAVGLQEYRKWNYTDTKVMKRPVYDWMT